MPLLKVRARQAPPGLGLAMAALLVFPALAQNLDPLYEALGKVPRTVLADAAPEPLLFVDLVVLRHLAEREGMDTEPDIVRRAGLGGRMMAMEGLFTRSQAAWSDTAGTDFSAVRYFVGFDPVPRLSVVWGLESKDAASGLWQTLVERGFLATGMRGVVSNDDPGLIQHQAADPWSGSQGKASFVGVKGNVLLQAATPAQVSAWIPDFAGMDEDAVVRAATNGLESAVGDHLVVQAVFVSPNPLLANADDGIPRYLGGFVVDAQADNPVIAVALTYEDCDRAETAVEVMARRWRDTMPIESEIVTEVVASSDDMCAATMRVTSESADATVNPAFDAFLRRQMTTGFPVLQTRKD